MGLSIGPASIAISSLNTPGANRPNPSEASPVSEEEPVRLAQQSEPAQSTAGFGRNTLSAQGAALITLDSNLAVAAELIPTVEELRERSRVVQAERQEEAPANRPTERTDDLRQRESVRPEPNPAVRNFVDEAEPVFFETRTDAPEQPESVEPLVESTQDLQPTRLDIQA